MNPLTSPPAAPASPAETMPVINLCLLISSLEYGGAERQVVEMVRSFDPGRVRPIVCSLSDQVPLAVNLPRRDEVLHIIQKYHRFDVTAVLRLARLLRHLRIDVVHAFLFDAEIIGRLAAALARVPVFVSSERNADYTRPRLHSIALKLTARLSDVMVANSQAGKRFDMRTLGLPADRIAVVHNGVDTDRFAPNPVAGRELRARLGLPPAATPVVGMIGSFKQQKAHDVFLRMAARVRETLPETRFLIVGEPLRDEGEAGQRYFEEMKNLAVELGLTKEQCLFAGSQADMPAVYNACDVTALVSRREGTPNVVLESMACGVPVVATDVADNSLIVADTVNGFIVAPEDSTAAAQRVLNLLQNPERRNSFATAARLAACEQFSLRQAAGKLEALYASKISKSGKSEMLTADL